MNRLLTLLVIVISLARGSYAQNTNAQPETHRLGKSELQSWIVGELKAGRSIKFESNEGDGLCCDRGSITLEIRTGQIIFISSNFYAGVEVSLPYAVQADGKVALASNSAYPVPSLLNYGIHDLYVFRHGSGIYVERNLDSESGFCQS